MAFIQAAVSADPAGAATTVSVSISAGGTGNHIIGMVAAQASGVTLSSVKDNNGVSYTIQDNLSDPANNTSGWSFYAENISGAPTSVIATFSTSQLARIQVVEWSGLAASSSLDGHNATITSPASATPSSGSFTPAVNGDLIYAAATIDSAVSTLTAGAASGGVTFTLRNAGTGQQNAYDETGIQATAAAVNPAFNVVGGGSQVGLVFGMAFKAAAGGGDTLGNSMQLLMM